MDERNNGTLVEMAHYLLHAKDLLTKFWAKFFYYANYLLNLVLTRVDSFVTPIEKWCKKNPLVGHLGTFR